MTHGSLLNEDWQATVERLGGSEALERSARETGAFLRARIFANALDMLRMILAYCLGDGGLRSTSAWAASVGLVDVANTALLYRLRQSEKWLAWLVGQALSTAAPEAVKGRPVRIIDATNIRKAGTAAKRQNKLWRIHSAFDLPAERFGFFELTDERGGERMDRVPVVKGEIRLADRAYMQPERIAAVMEAGADIVVRAGWKHARWLDAKGGPLNILSELAEGAASGLVDRPVWIARKSAPALALRLVAVKKPPEAAEAARQAARRAAQIERYKVSEGTLAAAEWVILVTSLPAAEFPAADIFALYRLRWRIELAFKRLKSLIGLKAPPGADERSAKPYLLAHLLAILLLEPLIDEFEDSPRLAQAA
ncbi:MAG TPA: IS4 family transposase [Rhodomicrobium sp.]|nr:IS4 family transposase [Rhodomicrobium sp.]